MRCQKHIGEDLTLFIVVCALPSIDGNGGKQVMSSYSYASKGPRAIRLVAGSGSLTVTSLTLHHLKSIGLD